MTTEEVKTTLEKQRDYVLQDRIQQMKKYVDTRQGGGSGLFDAELTIKSMRNVRYRSEVDAGADIIDNSIEAGASQIHVLTHLTNGKITEVAFLDDGSGILREFLPWAVSWGASSQHGDTGKRNVFGRFGFGLPTASINRGTAYDVISRTDTGPFAMVTVDTKNLPRGNDGLPTQPPSVDGHLPVWIVEYVTQKDTPFKGGLDALRTAVVWRDLDRLTSRSVAEFRSLFMNNLGVTYGGWLGQVSLFVDGTLVEPIDVLFTNPAARYFDVEGTRAEDHGTIRIPMKAPDGSEHIVTVRMSRIGLDAWEARYHSGGKGQPPKIRFNIRKNYNGIFMTRHGRFIELWSPLGIEKVSWNNYMRQVAVQLDFPPELDELFGITPDKQTISPKSEVIDILTNKGVFRAMKDLYDEVEKERKKRREESLGNLDDSDTRVSEAVMEKFDQMVTTTPQPADVIEDKRKEAKKNLERKIKETAAIANLSEDIVRETIVAETESKRFNVELVSLGANGVVYNPEQRGFQTVLQINVDHKFFQDVYSKIRPDQFEVKSGLELLLFTLAWCELESNGDKAAYYLNERIRWSQHLMTQMLVQSDVIASSNLSAFIDDDN